MPLSGITASISFVKALTRKSYQTWFVPIRPVALNSNELTIQVPHRLFYEFLEEHYIDVLKRGLTHALGTAGRLQYRIKANRPEPVPQGVASSNGIGQPAPTPSNPFVIPGMTPAQGREQPGRQVHLQQLHRGRLQQPGP